MNRIYYAILLALMVFAQLPATTVKGEDAPRESRISPKECLECHEKIWNEGTAKRFVHAPFQEKKCFDCHAADSSLGTEDSDTADESDPDKINWTGKSLVPATSHWFEFTTENEPAIMILEATYGSRVRLYREIRIPPLIELPNLTDIYQDKAPMINDVKVLAVEKGVFLKATISWKTDRPTTSAISYGIKELKQKTINDNRLQTDHLEILSQLEHGETYRFRIIAEDSVGNPAKSDIYEFSTASTFSSPGLEELEKCCLATPLGLKSRFYRKGGSYLINITLARPVKIFFKIKEGIGSENQEAMEEESPDIKHVIVNEKKTISLVVCKNCHQDMSGHHPVNVFPKKKMVIPDDYPTLDDGRISCVTCHNPHASDLQFLMIKDYTGELCVGCHSEFGSIGKNAPEEKSKKLAGNKIYSFDIIAP
ncbi:MAG: cytochrome c3 family protein [Desulfurivibrionaceae bacterium]